MRREAQREEKEQKGYDMAEQLRKLSYFSEAVVYSGSDNLTSPAPPHPSSYRRKKERICLQLTLFTVFQLTIFPSNCSRTTNNGADCFLCHIYGNVPHYHKDVSQSVTERATRMQTARMKYWKWTKTMVLVLQLRKVKEENEKDDMKRMNK